MEVASLQMHRGKFRLQLGQLAVLLVLSDAVVTLSSESPSCETIFPKIERDVAILWLLLDICGCYGVYVKLFFQEKSPWLCVTPTGQIHMKVWPWH